MGCLQDEGAKEQAAKDLEGALKLDPKKLLLYLSLGAVYASTNDPKKAVEVYDRGLEADKDGDARVLDLLRKARRETRAETTER